MIEINLLPDEFRRKDRFKVGVPDLPYVKILVAGGAVLLLLQLALAAFAVYQHFELSAVRAEAQRAGLENQAIDRQKEELAALKREILRVDALTQRRVHWSRMLHELTQTMTKGIWLRTLSIVDVYEASTGPEVSSAARKPGGKSRRESAKPEGRSVLTLRLEGSAVGQGQETALIGKYIKEMKENTLFADVFEDIQLVNINQRKIKEYDVYDFVLQCRFRREFREP